MQKAEFGSIVLLLLSPCCCCLFLPSFPSRFSAAAAADSPFGEVLKVNHGGVELSVVALHSTGWTSSSQQSQLIRDKRSVGPVNRVVSTPKQLGENSLQKVRYRQPTFAVEQQTPQPASVVLRAHICCCLVFVVVVVSTKSIIHHVEIA